LGAVLGSLGACLLDGFGVSTTLAMLCGAAVLNILMVMALIPVGKRRGGGTLRRWIAL
jgi:hypothetical protein